MLGLKAEGIHPVVIQRFAPFAEEVLSGAAHKVRSIHLKGSAVTPDFKEKTSDINSVFVLKELDFGFLRALAPLGVKYGKKGIAAPLVLTELDIRESVDVFPIEFLDLKLIHATIHGEDIFEDLRIERRNLRLQCEHEIRKRIIALRQGYISSLGDKEALTKLLLGSITGRMPVLRAVIYLLGKEPPVKRTEVLDTAAGVIGLDKSAFHEVLLLKDGSIRPSGEELNNLFERYYRATEAMGSIVDGIKE